MKLNIYTRTHSDVCLVQWRLIGELSQLLQHMTRHDTDSVYLTCSQKLTGSPLSLLHGTKQNIFKRKTN